MKLKIFASAAALSLTFAGVSLAEGKGDAAKGKELFEEKAEPVCSVCHNADSMEKKMGPGLKGVYKKAKLNNGKKPGDGVIKDIIMKGGGGMPGYEESLKPADVENILAYLRTL